MLRFSQIYCNNKKSKKQKQNANKNAQIHNTNTTKTRIANLHRYILVRGGERKWNSHLVRVGQGLWSCLGIVELLVASVVILLLDETTSILTWNWHTNNLFDSFNFTSKTEDKVNKPKNKKRQYTKANTVDKFPRTLSWLVRPIKSLAPTKTFTKRAQKQRKSYLTARGQYNAFRKSNRSHRRQKTSLFTSDQVPFTVPII